MNPLLRLPRALITASCAAAALSMGLDPTTVRSALNATPKPNRAYVDAPYDASFLLFVARPVHYFEWTRKRRLKWRRRTMARARALHAPPTTEPFKHEEWHDEFDMLLGGFPLAKLLEYRRPH